MPTLRRRIVVAILASTGSFAVGLEAQVQTSPTLELGLSLQGAGVEIVVQGEPLLVAVRLRLVDGTAETGPIALAPVSGSWADAIRVQLVRPSDGKPAAEAVAVGESESNAATVSLSLVAGGMWRFPAATLQVLAPGQYEVRARLAIDAAAPGSGGWTGAVESPAVALMVAPRSNLSDGGAQYALAVARDAIVDGRLEEAAATVDALLRTQPDDIQAWTLRIVIAEQAGNLPAAVLGLNRAFAIERDALHGGLEEPNPELATLQQQIMEATFAADPVVLAANAVPEWSWPPFDLIPRGDPTGLFEVLDSASDASGPSTDVVAAPVDRGTVIPFAEISDADARADSRGQWASTATASSEYGADRYNALQATGAPNVETYSDNPSAWCHSGVNSDLEWLEVGFAKPVLATELRVRQNHTPGTIARVEAFAADGRAQVLWEGVDPNTYPPRQIEWFVLRFPATPFLVQRVKLTLNIALTPGWKQIDAVQLVGDIRQDVH